MIAFLHQDVITTFAIGDSFGAERIGGALSTAPTWAAGGSWHEQGAFLRTCCSLGVVWAGAAK